MEYLSDINSVLMETVQIEAEIVDKVEMFCSLLLCLPPFPFINHMILTELVGCVCFDFSFCQA